MKNDILNKTNENNLKSPIRKSINVSNFDLSSLGNQSDDEYQKINNLINKFNINDHNDNLNNEKNNDIIDNLNNEQNNKIKSNLNDSDSESEYTIQNNSNKNNIINKKIFKKNNNNK